MIKMTSDRPLLVRGEPRTEFETDEQHAKELESAGRAVRSAPAEQPSALPDATADPESLEAGDLTKIEKPGKAKK